MATLLHIDVSPRGDHSVSRKLGAAFAEEWTSKYAGGTVVYRDLAKQALPFVDLQWIAGAYTAPEQHTPEQKAALKISDELIAELLHADHIVITTPMYNFAIPAALKAWIDHVVRHGKTFTIGAEGYKGLATGKKATFIVASGGNYSAGSPAEKYNQETPYLQSIFGFIGITDTNAIISGDTTAVSQGKVSEADYFKSHIAEVKAAV
jgi:FMN-dependent NADH-azoreductase